MTSVFINVLSELGLTTVIKAPFDIKLVLLSRILRSCAYSGLTLILAVYLEEIGLKPSLIGVYMSFVYFGDLITTFYLTLLSEKLGRKRTIMLNYMIMSITSFIFYITENLYILFTFAFIGTISVGAPEVGVWRNLEMATMSQLSNLKDRSDYFAWYAFSGMFISSFASLTYGYIMNYLQKNLKYSLKNSYKIAFLGYSTISFLLFIISFFYSKEIESEFYLKNNFKHNSRKLGEYTGDEAEDEIELLNQDNDHSYDGNFSSNNNNANIHNDIDPFLDDEDENNELRLIKSNSNDRHNHSADKKVSPAEVSPSSPSSISSSSLSSSPSDTQANHIADDLEIQRSDTASPPLDGNNSKGKTGLAVLWGAPNLKIILQMMSLNLIDVMSKAIVLDSWLSYYLVSTYKLDTAKVGTIFLCINIITSVSSLAGTVICKRYGPITAMIITHFPCSVFVFLIPFAKNYYWLLIFLMFRAIFKSMDLGSKNLFITSIATPEQLAIVFGLNNSLRTGGNIIAPIITGLFANSGNQWVTFIISALLRVLLYEFGIIFLFWKDRKTIGR
ncbi:unnamed protein product [[Candida] boidinii]|nr:hypothetical protein B5S30_g3360 [[Candida] boidinii]GMF50693.1 unnamed protein product [[Candida] boidinii]GMG00445.1 unnamed protein product [[Candida] boidinii]